MAVLFLVPALAMVGIPPLSGFVSKFALVDAGVGKGQYGIVAVSLLVSLLTLLSMIRVWSAVFWSPAEEASDVVLATPGRRRGLGTMVASTSALVACCLAVAVAAGPIYSLSQRTAEDLMNPAGYIDEVLGP